MDKGPVILYSFANPVFSGFAFYATICILKMIAMAFLTAVKRFAKGAFANPEDVTKREMKPILTDPDVERVRRGHQNDIENILPFILVGFLYVGTGPSLSTALWYFRIFTGGRIFHTLAYQIPLPQPSRALAFFSNVIVIIAMSLTVIMTACAA